MNNMDKVCGWFGLSFFDKFNIIQVRPCAWRKIDNPYYFTDEGIINKYGVLDNIHLADLICGALRVEKRNVNRVVSAKEFEKRVKAKLCQISINIKDDAFRVSQTETGCYIEYKPNYPEVSSRDFIISQDLNGSISVYGNSTAIVTPCNHFENIDDFENTLCKRIEELEVCPSCGAAIDPHDGEDNGYGKLHLYWKCHSCGTSGTAVIDQQNDNEFIGHEID